MFVAAERKNELHQLVRNLESYEKAYYKKMAKRYADQNDALHLRLFQLLEKSPVNDEQRFMKKLGIQSASHFSGLKNHLWKDILSSMVYQRRNDPPVQLEFMLSEVETLLARNLVSSAEKLLRMAWKTAWQYELYGTQLRLLHLYYKLLPYYDYKQFKLESLRLLQQQREVLKRLQWEQQLQILRRELVAFRQFTYLRCSTGQLARIAEIEQELGHLHLHQECTLLHILYHFNKGAAAHLAIRFGQCTAHVEAVMALWQAHPHYIVHSAALFFDCCDYAFYNAFALKDPAAASRYLDIYTLLATHLDSKEQERWEIMAFHTRLKIYHKQARYDAVSRLMDEHADDILSKTRRALPPGMGLSVVCSLCITYFVLEKYDKAEDLVLDVINTNRDIQRDDLLYFTSVFYLIILLEKNSYQQLANAISTSYFRLYNQKKLQPFEKDLMLFLRHLSNETAEKEQQQIIRSFITRLDHYRNDPVKDLYFLYFNYYGWLESKSLKIPYMEYRRRQEAAEPAGME